MTLYVDIKSNRMADALLAALSPENRTTLNKSCGRDVMNLVRRHIRSYMRTKHHTANSLGARPKGHYTQGEQAITMTADAQAAEVRIPIPGINRAFHDLTIRPGEGKKYLTIPKAAISYGRKVVDVKALGWKVFRPAAKGAKMTQRSPRRYTEYQNIYMGYAPGDKKPTLLYVLVDGVLQRKEPTLLPSDEAIRETASDAIIRVVSRAVDKARSRGRVA